MKDIPPGSGIALGMALGAAFGTAFDNIAIGVSMGLIIGVMIDAANRARMAAPKAVEKMILVDAVDCFVSDTGGIFAEMRQLLDTYPNRKIILTNAPDDKFEQYGLNRVPYEVFTLRRDPMKTDPKYFELMLAHFGLNAQEAVYFEHSPEAVESARKAGITSYLYDHTKKDLAALKSFLDSSLKA